MNHELLKAIIFDHHAVIRAADIMHRGDYEFDPSGRPDHRGHPSRPADADGMSQLIRPRWSRWLN